MLDRIRKVSLTKQILYLVIIMLIVLLISFVITNRIAKQIIERKVTESVEQIMFVVDEKMRSFNMDMQGISTFLFYSPTVQNYLHTEDELTRVLEHREILTIFMHATSMKENIRGIQLYHPEGELLARIGEGDDVIGIESSKALVYSSVLKLDTRPSENFYAITTPIYGIDSNKVVTEMIAIGRFYMDVSNLTPILETAKITKSSQVLLLDSDSNIIAREEQAMKEDFHIEQWSDSSKYITQTFTMPYSNWQLVSIVPRNELLNDLNTIKQFNITTYVIVIIIQCLFLIIFFNRILQPIKGLLDFLKRYPKQGADSRYEVVHQNEIGVLGTSLNKMLDEIRNLSDTVQSGQKQMYEIELSKKQMEVSAYRNQINPHFLYNTFESIRAIAFYYDVQEIANITEALSNMFRYAVKMNNFAMIKDEIAHIQEYAKIVEFRFRGRLKVVTDVEEGLQDVRSLKMLLQPIVENAVFHGLERRVGEGVVSITVNRTEENLVRVSIKDNGIGMSSEKQLQLMKQLDHYDKTDQLSESAGKGVGMINIYRRLKLFYGEAAVLSIKSEYQQGTEIVVTFPEESEVGKQEG
jgi:two-component system sensor histidine kinase YesM